MKILLFFLSFLLLLISCRENLIKYREDQVKNHGQRLEYPQICIEGVSYIQFPSGASVKYLPDGNIATCE